MARPRDPAKTVEDVLSMRALLAKERRPRHPFDLKLAQGGLVDLEFIAQSAQLLAGATIDRPQAPTAVVLSRLEQVGLVPNGARLAEIHRTYSTILQVMSAALVSPFKDEAWSGAFRDLLAGLTHYPDFSRLELEIAGMQAEVQSASERWYARARELGGATA
jgi:glutamate-ammonia-ligase adenylyltransferase